MTFAMGTGRNAGERARRAVTAILPRSVDIEAGADDHSADLVVNGVPVQVKWIGEGRLRQVRDMLAHVRERPDVVVARHLSPGAREALTRAGVGWIDETGAAEVSLPRLVISRSGQPEQRPEHEPRWTRSVLAVAEALLCGSDATVSAAKEATSLSTASCAKALGTLTDLGLLTASARRGRASGRRVEDSDRLLDAYAAAAVARRPNARLSVGVAWRDPLAGLSSVGSQLTSASVDWAATGTAAAALLGPYLTSFQTAEVYVDAYTHPELEAVADEAGLRPMEGGRLLLRPFPTVATRRLATVLEGVAVAPWPRVYADLRITGVRGEEAAEHLREVMRGS